MTLESRQIKGEYCLWLNVYLEMARSTTAMECIWIRKYIENQFRSFQYLDSWCNPSQYVSLHIEEITKKQREINEAKKIRLKRSATTVSFWVLKRTPIKQVQRDAKKILELEFSFYYSTFAPFSLIKTLMSCCKSLLSIVN